MIFTISQLTKLEFTFNEEAVREWKQINFMKGTGAIVRFEDERDQVFLQIYFRVRIID